MTGGPSAGPASAYATFRTPASICLSGANEVFVPGLITGSAVPAGCARGVANMPRCVAAAVAAAPPTKRRRSRLMLSWSYSCPLAAELILSSAEREAKSLDARLEKLDFKLAISDWSGLPDQLVQTLLGHRADTLLIDI